jgi:hypothetical protein
MLQMPQAKNATNGGQSLLALVALNQCDQPENAGHAANRGFHLWHLKVQLTMVP